MSNYLQGIYTLGLIIASGTEFGREDRTYVKNVNWQSKIAHDKSFMGRVGNQLFRRSEERVTSSEAAGKET